MKTTLYHSLNLGVAATALASCHPAAPATPAVAVAASAPGNRIISLDYCADQMLLGLVEKSRIAAVSPEVASDPLFSAPRARGLPRVRPSIERILALRPTLVIRSYGGGPRMESALRRAGIPVFTLPYADDVPAIRHAITASGEALGARPAAARRIASLDAALSRSRSTRQAPPTALYVTPGDVTTGPDSLVGRLFTAAGYTSYEQRPGWHRLPVERLVAQPPALVVRGFFDSPAHRQDRWSSSNHVALRRTLENRPSINLPGSEIACGNWLAGNALDRLLVMHERLK